MSSSRLGNCKAASPPIKAEEINQDQRRLSIWLQVVNDLGDKGSATAVLETGTDRQKKLERSQHVRVYIIYLCRISY